jgi:hypothetical protein
LHNVHAVYYDLKEGGLTRAATAALADKSQLATMGRAARAHVLSHHTVEAMARHIVCTSLHTPHAGGCIP